MHYFTWSNAAEQFQDKKKERFLVVEKDIRRLTGATYQRVAVDYKLPCPWKKKKKLNTILHSNLFPPPYIWTLFPLQIDCGNGLESYGKRKRRDLDPDSKLSDPDSTKMSNPTHKHRAPSTPHLHDENKTGSMAHSRVTKVQNEVTKARPQEQDMMNVTESNVRQKVPLQLAIIVRPLYDDNALAETMQELNLDESSSPGASSRQMSEIGESSL